MYWVPLASIRPSQSFGVAAGAATKQAYRRIERQDSPDRDSRCQCSGCSQATGITLTATTTKVKGALTLTKSLNEQLPYPTASVFIGHDIGVMMAWDKRDARMCRY
jgi:hypothetical protein